MFQGCFKFSFNGVSRVFWGCFKVSFKDVSRVLQGYFKGASRLFQGCFKVVSRVFQGCYKGVSRNKIISMCFMAMLIWLTRVILNYSRGLSGCFKVFVLRKVFLVCLHLCIAIIVTTQVEIGLVLLFNEHKYWFIIIHDTIKQ